MSVFRYVDTQELEIRNPIFISNAGISTGTDTIDTGLVSSYYDGTNVLYNGLYRQASSGKFQLFSGSQIAPNVTTGFVDPTGTGYVRADLELQNLHAYGNIVADGDFTVSGTVTTFNVNTLTVEDNIIVANAGPANVKPDGGFVVRRAVSSVITDTAKQLGTASAAGTTTTITLQAANGHGTVLDYYKGWVISFGGDVTGSATVTTSSAANPPVLTFDTAATAATTTSSTYNLYNRVFVGTIWDESTGMETFYGFPRENLMGTIDLAGDSGDGNLADYIDTRMRDLYVSRDLYVEGVIKSSVRADDNIITVNAGPTNSEDAGYVVTRTPARVATDTPQESGTASAAGTTTAITLQAANAHGTTLNYYAGWVIKFGGDVTGTAKVVSNTAANPPVLTFDTAASGSITTSSTYQLFNKVYVGTIYDESTDTLMAVGFPREIGEGVIDPVSPVNGNVPSYVDFSVRNLNISGTLNLTGGSQVNTITLTAAATITATQILDKDIIYLNPAANATFTLSTLALIALAANKSKITMFVNISAFIVTLAAGSGNTIEGLTNLQLKRQYTKTVLTASDQLSTVWTIKG